MTNSENLAYLFRSNKRFRVGYPIASGKLSQETLQGLSIVGLPKPNRPRTVGSLVVGFRSRLNNSLIFIRRLRNKTDSKGTSNSSTLYYQKTAGSLTGVRARSVKLARKPHIAVQFAELAADKVAAFFSDFDLLNLNENSKIKHDTKTLLEKNKQRYSIGRFSRSYSAMLRASGFTSTLMNFFANPTEKHLYRYASLQRDRQMYRSYRNAGPLTLRGRRIRSANAIPVYRDRRMPKVINSYPSFPALYTNFIGLKNLLNRKRNYILSFTAFPLGRKRLNHSDLDRAVNDAGTSEVKALVKAHRQQKKEHLEYQLRQRKPQAIALRSRDDLPYRSRNLPRESVVPFDMKRFESKVLKLFIDYKRFTASALNYKHNFWFKKQIYTARVAPPRQPEELPGLDFFVNLNKSSKLNRFSAIKLFKGGDFLKKLFKNIESTREHQLRTVYLQRLIHKNLRRYRRLAFFERSFWRAFIGGMSRKFFYPFFNSSSRDFRRKHGKRYRFAKRFQRVTKRRVAAANLISIKSVTGQRIAQPILFKALITIKIPHNGLRPKKRRRK